MRIFPDKENYFRLAESSSRVPVCGETHLPNLQPALLFRELFSEKEEAFLFESGKGPEATARYTFMGVANGRSIKIINGRAFSRHSVSGEWAEIDVSQVLDALNFEDGVREAGTLNHFWGGWVGYIGYEMARLFENLPPKKEDPLQIPDLYFFQVEQLIVYDHKEEKLRIIVSGESSSDSKSYGNRVAAIETLWSRIQGGVARCSGTFNRQTHTAKNGDNRKNGLQSNLTQAEYIECVERAKLYIEEGDIYQANLSQRFTTAYDGDDLGLFFNLRYVNPSPFSGLLRFKELGIVSSSPERLVKVEEDCIETRPIAGTRPRGLDADTDQSLSSELLLNEKERAEHLMLVDLERNDLGRICETGSVKVTDLMFLEQYSHVSHIVSNIEGKLQPQASVKDILRAVFPGGTITGCPKIRSMEIIRELEPQPRGPYCGSMGYIGFSRHMDLNIIIRSFILKDGKAWFNVGAGIVADSEPEKEYQETLDKAAALVQVLASQNNGGSG